MSEWQPIETAPKDSDPVLVLEDGVVMILRCTKGNWHDDESGYFRPTDWMPLPEPPDE